MADSPSHAKAVENIPDFYQGSAMFLKKEVERHARNLCFLGEKEAIEMTTSPSEENEDVFIVFSACNVGNDGVRVLITGVILPILRCNWQLRNEFRRSLRIKIRR